MTSSKLFFYLSQLSQEELDDFKAFAGISFFNPSPNLLRILEAFETHVLPDPEQAPSREAFFKLLYPDRKFNDGYFRKLLAEVLQLFTEFIGHKRLKEDKIQKRVYFLKEMNEKRWWKYLQSYYSKSKKETRKEHSENMEMHRMNVLLDFELFQYIGTSQIQPITEATQIFSASLDQYFSMTKFYLSMVWASNWVAFKLPDLQISYLDQLSAQMEAEPEKQSLGTLAYYYAYYTDRSPQERSYYFGLKELFRRRQHEMSPVDGYEIGGRLLSYCIRRINAGTDVPFFQNETLDHYETLLESGRILTDGKLNPVIYKNFVILGSRLGQFERVEAFMEEYSNRLTENPYGVAVDYNQAILHFFKGNFAVSRRLLNRILQYNKELASMLYGLDTRGYLCRTDYELGDLEALQYHGEAFNQFIRRNKSLTPHKKKSYHGFTRLLLRLANIVNGNPQKRKANLQKFQADLDQHGKMPYTGWLREKLEEAQATI